MAIALPYLDCMSWGKTKDTGALPKRLVVSYIAYGVYEPRTEDGEEKTET